MNVSADEGGAGIAGMPSAQEILLPPILLALLLIFGLMCLSLMSQPHWWKHFICQKREKICPLKHYECIKDGFLTEHDELIISKFVTFQNRPKELLVLALPACTSLLFCPFTLLLHEPIVNFFWSPDMFPNGPPNINDVVSCFLTPAGLVYAIAFGFAFQEALGKQTNLSSRLVLYLNKMTHVQISCKNISTVTLKEYIDILEVLKNLTINTISTLVSNDSPNVNHEGDVWEIMKTAKKATNMKELDKADEMLCQQLIQDTMELHALSSDPVGQLKETMKAVQWIFLETLGIIAFFGILMLKAQSYRLELTMCILTVFSISLFCYVLGDLDNPYHGVFRIKLDILIQHVDNLIRELDQSLSQPAESHVQVQGSSKIV